MNSVSKTKNSSDPLEPCFSYASLSTVRDVITSPGRTGSRYSKRSPPLSQPLPYSRTSGISGVSVPSATRKVGGASSRQRGLGSPIASQKRRRWPASTVVVLTGPSQPIRALMRSSREV